VREAFFLFLSSFLPEQRMSNTAVAKTASRQQLYLHRFLVSADHMCERAAKTNKQKDIDEGE
jgi:hypothetical protein